MNNVLLKAHRYEKDELRGNVGKSLLTDFCTSGKIPLYKYDYTKDAIIVQPIEEYPVPFIYGYGNNNKPKYGNKYIDMVYIVSPGKTSPSRRECFTIGIEIKTSEKDLWRRREQIQSYYGQTNYFFLAVPKNIVGSALVYARNEPRLGVMDMTNCRIVKYPKRQNVDKGVIADMFYRSTFVKTKLPIMCFRPVV